METDSHLRLEQSAVRHIDLQRIDRGPAREDREEYLTRSTQRVDPALPAAVQYSLHELGAQSLADAALSSAHSWPDRYESELFQQLAVSPPGQRDLIAQAHCDRYLVALGYRPGASGAFDAACDLYLGRAALGETFVIVACSCVGFLYGSGTGDATQGALGVECGYLARLWELAPTERDALEQRAHSIAHGRDEVFSPGGSLSSATRDAN